MDEIADLMPAVWPGLTEVFRGWPPLELSGDNLPCAMMALPSGGIPMEPSGAGGAKMTAQIVIVGLFPLPTDKTINLMRAQLDYADLMIAQLESQFVWAYIGGQPEGCQSYITEVSAGSAPIDGAECIRVAIDFSVEFHCPLGS